MEIIRIKAGGIATKYNKMMILNELCRECIIVLALKKASSRIYLYIVLAMIVSQRWVILFFTHLVSFDDLSTTGKYQRKTTTNTRIAILQILAKCIFFFSEKNTASVAMGKLTEKSLEQTVLCYLPHSLSFRIACG